MPLFQGFRPVTGTICPSRAAAVVGPSRAPQGMKKGRRPRRRPRLKLSDKAGPDQCPVPGENALFPAQIAGFLAVSRPVPVYPVFLKYVVPVQLFLDLRAWCISLRILERACRNMLIGIFDNCRNRLRQRFYENTKKSMSFFLCQRSFFYRFFRGEPIIAS